MKLRSCSAEEFKSAITDDPADKFAKTFVAKANMQEQWGDCTGAWDGEELLGAIITTISKRSPVVANLQLLHTFAKHRGKGVGRVLCDHSLTKARERQANYFRVSAEPNAVEFYKKVGFTFLGEQKSGCQLSMFRIAGDSFSEGIYDLDDNTIYNAVFSKRKGGCVRVFLEPSSLTDWI